MKAKLNLVLALILFMGIFNFALVNQARCAHWEWQNPLPTGNNLQDVWRFGGEIFAVGTSGTIIHFDGSVWTTMESGTSENLFGVWGSAVDNVFAVGNNGTILQYNGTTWNAMTSSTSVSLYAIWGSAADNVFAVGSSGTIVSYNGSSWTTMTTPSATPTLRGVWGTSGGEDVYAVGSSGTIWHYTALDGWQVESSPTTNYLYDIWGTSNIDIYAVGSVGTILQYTMVEGWQPMTPVPTTATTLLTIWGIGSDIFAAGSSNAIWRYVAGVGWTVMTSGATNAWTGISGSASNDVYVVGSNGTILRYDGNIDNTWSFMSSTVASAGLEDISGSSSTNVYAVGYTGTILQYNGSIWSQIPTVTTERLNGVWVSANGHVFAVGGNGIIVHYNGVSWSESTPPPTEELYEVWGSSDTDVFAVGNNGTILHYNGSDWSLMDSDGVTGWLVGVWGSSGSDVFALGWSGAVLHYDGGSWTQTADLQDEFDGGDIWGSSGNDVYAVGRYGVIYHYDGNAWRKIYDTGGGDLRCIWGSSANDIYAASTSEILHYDGYVWHPVSISFNSPTSIWGASADDIYVVTGQGGIVHYAVDTYYVDTARTDDTGDGLTPGTAWKTLHYAVDQINAMPAGNYQVNIAVGTYSVTNGEADNQLTITQDNVTLLGEDGVILDGEYPASNAWAFGVTLEASEVKLWNLGITRFRGDGNPGISASRGANNRIENCDVYDNDYGIRVYDTSTGTAIVACNLYLNSSAVVSADTDITLVGNKIYENNTGIQVNNYADSDLTVVNNLFYGTTTEHYDGLLLSTYSGTTTLTLYHNTFTGIQNAINLFYSGQTATLTADIKYNIVANANSIGIAFDDGIGGTFAGSDYNTVYNCATPYSNVTPGANDITTDPSFVNPGSFDFHLQLLSLSVNAIPTATNDPVLYDLEGVSRPQGAGYDMGAYETMASPGLVSVSPFNGALGIAVNQTITASFTQTMNPSTFSSTTFQVRDSNGDIPGTLLVTGDTAVFTPEVNLAGGTEIFVRITTGVEDSAGNSLGAAYAWFFRTVGEATSGASFSTQSVISTAAVTAFSVHAADIDGDGDQDVLSASDGDDTVAWYANTDGLGTFGTRAIITNSAVGARSVFSDDLNGDGNKDVLSASWGATNGANPGMEVAWFENAPGTQVPGTFGSQNVIALHSSPISVIAADLDNDGDKDALSASYGDNTIAWYENTDGLGGTWSAHTISTAANGAWDVFAADLDNDGDLDVISASNASNDVAWYENRLNEATNDFGPQEIISQAANGARVVRAADMDQDGDMDVISASWFDGKIAWYPNLGGTFGDPATNQNLIATANGNTQAMHVADLDNDGDADVMYGSWQDGVEHKIIWMENINGNGLAWISHDISTDIIGCQSLYAADLDADGDLDVLSASQDDNKIAWYENQIGESPTQYTLTVNNVGQGSVTPNPAGYTYDSGTQVTLTPFPDEGWRFSEWSGDLTGATNPGTITMDTDKAITATFVEKSPPIPPTADSPANEAIISEGSTLTLDTSDFSDPDGDDHYQSHWEVWRADTGTFLVGYPLTSSLDMTLHQITAQLDAGLKYTWRVGYEDLDGNITWSQEYSFKVGTPVTETLPAVQAGTDVGDFGMISIVHWPNDPSPTAVFNIDYDPANYRIGTYDALTGTYIEFGEGLEMEPGRSYWILARDGLTINFNGIPVSLVHDLEVCLHYGVDGWNMIAPPNDAKYLWGDVQVGRFVEGSPGLTVVPISISDVDSTVDTLIDRRIWQWESGTYVSYLPEDNFELQSYSGYWVNAKLDGVYLVFPESAQVAGLSTPGNTLLAMQGKALQWLKGLLPDTRQALADNDTPPMPMGALDDNTVDPVFQGCFVESINDKP